ncbi:MAG: hypothetical protein ACK55Z_33660, partial [bacterium]
MRDRRALDDAVRRRRAREHGGRFWTLEITCAQARIALQKLVLDEARRANRRGNGHRHRVCRRVRT